MALDPLKFQVAIQDDATGQLNKIEQEFNKLKDKTINVKVEGIQDLQQLLQLLGQQSAPKIGDKVEQEANKAKDAAKKVGDAAQTTSEQIQKLAQSAIKGSFEQFVNDLADVKKAIQNDNFTAFSKRISECAESITKMTEAFSAFKVVIGDNKELKDLLTGWGAAMKEVSAAIKTMNAVKNSSTTGTTQKEDLRQTEAGLVKVADALGRVRNAASGGGSGGSSVPFLESITRVGEGNIQTLIKEQGHIERLIQIAEKGIKFGEGHDVAGMQGLRVQMRENLEQLLQYRDVLKNILYQAQNGNQGIIHWLNQSGALRTTPFGKDAMGNDVTLLGGHFDQLTHSVTGTSTAMRQLNMEMRLDNADKFKQWNTEKLTEGLHKVNQAIADIRTSWDKASGSADADMTRRVAEQVNRLHDIRAKILSAMGNNETLRTPRGYQQVINANNNEQINQAKRLRQELDGISRAEEKQAKDAERYTEQQKRAYEKAEKDKVAAIEEARKVQEQAARQAQQDQNTQERNQQRINGVLQGTVALFDRLANARTRGENLGVDTSLAERKLQQLEMMQNRVLGFSDFGNNHAVQMLIGEWNALQRELRGVASAQEKVNNVQERAYKKDAADSLKQQVEAAKQAQKENEKWAESSRRAGVEVTNLEIKIRKLKEVEAKGSAVGVDTTALKQQIALLEQYLTAFRQMASGSRNYGFAGDLLKDVGYQSATIRAKDEAQAVRNNTAEKERNAAATSHMSSEEQRLAQALNQTAESARGQSQVLADLKSMATQYLGVWGGQQFLHNIIEIGGQLEMQRLSIGAILQNTAQANELFDKIKGLATQSPFGVVQLDQMTKQLTAYGFKYNELYDMTKRLADISAATGTDVSRLALALGHVRSEAALSGYTLRQFSMANVPLLEKLSEKLGKTTKEIREMVKKKEVGYDDVIGVLKDLTNEGGMFYNMQEVMSESVKAKFKNVKDAMDIMYGEMAEGAPGDALKGVADVLMELTRHWKDLATIMTTAAAVWGIHRAAILLTNAALGSNAAAVSANILSYKKKRAVELQQKALTKILTAEEKKLIATRNTITAANIRTSMSIGAMTKSEALRLVGLRKLSIEEVKALIRSGEFTAAEVRMALQGKVLGINLGYAGNMMRYLGRSARMAMAAFFTNPMTWIMAGISAIMELWQMNSREMERAEEVSKRIYESSQESIKNIAPSMRESGFRYYRSDETKKMSREVDPSTLDLSDVGRTEVILPSFNADTAQEQMDKWIETIKDYAINSGKILNEALYDSEGHAKSLEEQFKSLAKAMADLSLQQYAMQDLGDVFENAENATDTGWTWFNDTLQTNVKDYLKSLKKYKAGLSSFVNDNKKAVKAAVDAARDQDTAFAKATEGNSTYAQSFAYLVEHQEEYTKAAEAAKAASGVVGVELVYQATFSSSFESRNTFDDVRRDREEVMKDLQLYYAQIEGDLALKGVDVTNMTDNQKQALLMSYKQYLDTVEGMTSETQLELMKMFADHFKIKFKVEDEKLKRSEKWHIEQLNKLTGKTWNVSLTATSNINDVITELQGKYKAAKEYFEKTESIRLKLGIKMNLGDLLTEEQKEKILSRVPESMKGLAKEYVKSLDQVSNAFKETTNAAKEYGIDLDPEATKKKKEDADKAGKKKKDDAEKARREAERKAQEAERKRLEAEREANQKIIDQLRERKKVLKDAFDTYKKWEKELGRNIALEQVQKQWGDLFAKWGKSDVLPWSGFTSADVINWETYIEELRAFSQKQWDLKKQNKNLNFGKEFEDLVRQILSLQDGLQLEHFQEETKRFSTAVQNELEDLTRRWDVFNQTVNALGDPSLAAKLAKFTGNDFDWGISLKKVSPYNATSADSLRYYLDRLLFDSGYEDLFDFGKVLQMPDNDLENYVRDFITSGFTMAPGTDPATYKQVLDDFKTKIPGIITLLKKWRDLQKDVNKQAPIDLARILSESNTILLQRNKIEDDYRKSFQQADTWLNGIEKPTNEQKSLARRAKELAEAKRDLGLSELAPDVRQFYTALSSLNRRTARQIGNELLTAYKRAFDSGALNADQYSERVKKVLDNMTLSDDQLSGSLYDRMSRMGGWLFRRGSDKNRSDALASAGYVSSRIEEERVKGVNADQNLIAVLERLEQALTNVAWGAGGREEVVAAGNLGKSVRNWGDLSFEEQAELAEKARDEKRKKKNISKTDADEFEDDLGRVMGQILDRFKEFKEGLDFVGSFFDSLGVESAANAAADASSILGGAMEGASALSAFGPYGQAAGAALGLVSGIAQTHDARLERQIAKLREDVQKIEANTKLIEQARERTLGYDTGDLRRLYSQQYSKDDRIRFFFGYAETYKSKAQKDMYEYYSRNSSGTGYQQEYQNLLDQRKDYMEILNKQESKKKKSKSDIEETKAKIAELDDQIMHFTQDLAKELWSIDIKGWADQISDALASAFENGESLAKAYKETVTSILQQVMSKMMQLGFLEPMFQSLQDKLFGYTDDKGKKHDGVLDPNNMLGSIGKVQATIADFFGNGGEGEKTITAATEFMTAFQRGLENAGLSVLNDSANALTSSVQGTSEETSDLLAGYINALRQDVAVNRILLTQFVTQLWPEYVESFANHVRTVANIDVNVQLMMEMMRDGGGAFFRELQSLRSRFDSVVDGIESLSVR